MTKAVVAVAMGYFSYSYYTDYERAAFPVSQFTSVSIRVNPATRHYLLPSEIGFLFYFQSASGNRFYFPLKVENDTIHLDGIIPSALVLTEETDAGVKHYSIIEDSKLRSYSTPLTSLSFSLREYQLYHCLKAIGLFLLVIVLFAVTDMLTIRAYKILFIVSTTLSIAVFGFLVFGFLYGDFFRTIFL